MLFSGFIIIKSETKRQYVFQHIFYCWSPPGRVCRSRCRYRLFAGVGEAMVEDWSISSFRGSHHEENVSISLMLLLTAAHR